MEDVAARAGVSRALVSIVFREAPGASASTRARVRAAAAELGYRPDQRARLLGRLSTRLIGVTYGVRHAFHADLVEALYAAAEAAGYDLVLSGTTPVRGEQEAVDQLLAYRCQALVMLGPTLPAAEIRRFGADQPVVVVARRLRAPHVDVVRTHDADGVRQAVQHLLDLGHRDIAHVHGARAPGAGERRRGYVGALRSAGLPEAVTLVPGGLTEDDGVRAARHLLSLESLPTAVVAFNDRCSVGVLNALRAGGVRVPEQVSLVGFDDDRLAALPYVDLTTVRQDAVEIARHAVRRAVERVELPADRNTGDHEMTECIVSPRLVLRGTTAPPPPDARGRPLGGAPPIGSTGVVNAAQGALTTPPGEASR
jgi:DNA-binding LacI/PurR family transcriptional regulator